MMKHAKKLLAMMLCLAMALSVLPAVALEADAAAGDITSDSIVLFEDDLNYTSATEAEAAGWVNVSSYLSFKDGCIVVDAYKAVTTNIYMEYSLTDLGIPMSTKMPMTITCEMRVSAPLRSYMFTSADRLNADGTSYTGSYLTGKYNAIDKTASEEFVTVSFSFTSASSGTGTTRVLDAFNISIGARKDTTDDSVTGGNQSFVKIDSVKITLSAATTVTDAAAMKTCLGRNTAYLKLPSDMTVDGSLTLGDNAVLDLNGHKLTATAINGGANSVIMDSSADNSGKLDTADLVLDNKDHPTLPLKTASGYILTEPKLGSERAFVVESSGNAFTMDFRPGFGTSIRENYLQYGESGIKMTAKLSWVDIYGNAGEMEENLDGTDIFDGMYATETSRGRLKVANTAEYRSISVTFTLESCGAEVVFDPVVYTNNGVTTHFAADFETGTVSSTASDFNVGQFRGINGSSIASDGDNKILTTLGTNQVYFAETIATGEGKLVIAFDFKSDAGNDSIAFRIRKDSKYINILSTGGHAGNHATIADFYKDNNSENYLRLSGNGTYNAVRMEIDLATGAFKVMCNGAVVKSGTCNETQLSALNVSSLYLHAQDTETHYIDNLRIYTVKN